MPVRPPEVGMPLEDRRGSAYLAGLALLALLAPSPAGAFEFFDGRLQVHGFYESQLRAIARNYDSSDDWDLTQWAQVLNIEVEADIAPDGWGPFDLISAFGRVEARYDCVWTRGCGMFSSADTYGNRAARLPGRLGDGERAGYRNTGTLQDGDHRRFASIPREFLGYEFRNRGNASPTASKLFDIQGLDTLFDVVGQDEVFGPNPVTGIFDDPAPFVFSEPLDNCVFAFRRTRGPENGTGSQVLGPWNPKCKTAELGRLANRPNPMREDDITPILREDPSDPNSPNIGGFGALPMRPVPLFGFDESAPPDQARGIYLPNQELARTIRGGDFGDTDQDFSQADLSWNHGASQEGERELKELYLDMELFDSRLWIRAGRQTIVWGKTELFRTTDQFNPQDLALASLPSLEESRVAQWGVRGVWAFYTLGPLDDVRLELAANYDEFEPNDLGRCGEPYAPLPVCNKTFGLFIHGLTGLGVAGEVRPPDPWDSWKGWEVGARLEFRWDRFSFALSDFYGYDDFPYQDRLFTYSRNVDPMTGRPRHTMANGPCTTGAEASCLLGSPVNGTDPGQLDPTRNSLQFHSVNQQIFAMICSTSVGLLPALDPTACGQTVFNSHVNILTNQPAVDPPNEATVAGLASNLLAGNFAANVFARAGLTFGVDIPHLELSQDPCDGLLDDCMTPGNPPNPIYSSGGVFPTLNLLTTSQQQALYGCGPYYGTDCEADGLDLMNTEATALMQSWPGIEGAGGPGWNTTNALVTQPGTLDFDGGPLCTRIEGGLSILPGCRGPDYQTGTLIGGVPVTDSDYDVNVDGDPSGLLHPFFDPASPFYQGPFDLDGDGFPESPLPAFNPGFRTELSAASFNGLMAFVALSSPPELYDSNGDRVPDTPTDENGDGRPDPKFIAETLFDPNDPTVLIDNGFDDDGDGVIDNPEEGDPLLIGPYRTNGCSFANPAPCSNFQSLFQVTGVQRNTVSAAGNERFGRRDFVWQGGTPVVLRYQKRNVLGFSMDWAEDLTKTNWGIEATWIEGLQFTDLDEPDRLTEADTYNLTVSIDRPTFINFLNPNRTFFLNMQTFFQYVDGYRKGFASNGPWNVLATFTIQTGFFRDRLNPNMTFVYDMRSNSGAWLPSVQYRYTENLSVTFGLALFSGRMQSRQMAAAPTSLSNRAASHRGSDFVENGLSVVRERDEVFLKLRYTF